MAQKQSDPRTDQKTQGEKKKKQFFLVFLEGFAWIFSEIKRGRIFSEIKQG